MACGEEMPGVLRRVVKERNFREKERELTVKIAEALNRSY